MNIKLNKNDHIVIKKSDLDKADLLKAKQLQDQAARKRKMEGREPYPEYLIINKDEKYYPKVMRLVVDEELGKMNIKKAAEMFAEPFNEPEEKIKWDLENALGDDGLPSFEDTLKRLNVRVDAGHVEIDGVDFLQCPDCRKYRKVQYPESFIFNVARLCCNCGFKFEIPSETKTIAFGKLKRFVAYKRKGKMGADSLT